MKEWMEGNIVCHIYTQCNDNRRMELVYSKSYLWKSFFFYFWLYLSCSNERNLKSKLNSDKKIENKINAFPFCFQRIPGKKTKVWSVLDETTLSFFQENKVLKITFYSYFVLWKYTKYFSQIHVWQFHHIVIFPFKLLWTHTFLIDFVCITK